MEPAQPPRELTISYTHFNAMREHAIAGLPEEACGVLAGLDGRCLAVMPLTNALHSPTRYAVAPEELLRVFTTLEQNGWELLAIFHSHPYGEAQPSATDRETAYYPHSAYLILAPLHGDWVCRAFLIDGKQVSEIPLRVTAAGA
ncbi:MAG: M67 family metallopeptidase [Gammaproteobacteria bacterium]|nr:M67 family metallopeptidase [Gammaproteobacteria bacterium]